MGEPARRRRALGCVRAALAIAGRSGWRAELAKLLGRSDRIQGPPQARRGAISGKRAKPSTVSRPARPRPTPGLGGDVLARAHGGDRAAELVGKGSRRE